MKKQSLFVLELELFCPSLPVYSNYTGEKQMSQWSDELIQTTREYFETTKAGLMKGGSGRFGIANKLKNGAVSIISQKDVSQSWNYDSVEAMIEDGWVVD